MTVNFPFHHSIRVRKKNRRRSSYLVCFLWIYLSIFLVGCIIIIFSVVQIHNDNISAADHQLPFPHYHRLSNVDRRHFETFGWPLKQIELPFNCALLNEAKSFEYLTSGWTKNVFKLTLDNDSYAVKTVNTDGEDVRRCSGKESWRKCYDQASSKMLKEFIVLQELQHPNIVKVVGWCINDENVAMVLELCSSVDTVSLLRMPFARRLKISLDLARLIYYLSSTPLGSIAINDFRREQFVLCGDNLKITDLDDIGIDEPSCRHHQDCPVNWCDDYVCRGHNELQNVREMFSQFFSLILAFDAPKSLHTELANLLLGPKQWDSLFVLNLIEEIYSKYCFDNKSSF